MTQSSSFHGRLEQQLSERDSVIRERDEKIATLERKLTDSSSQVDSLTSRLSEQELVVAGKDQRITELNALIGDRTRYNVIYRWIVIIQLLSGLENLVVTGREEGRRARGHYQSINQSVNFYSGLSDRSHFEDH